VVAIGTFSQVGLFSYPDEGSAVSKSRAIKLSPMGMVQIGAKSRQRRPIPPSKPDMLASAATAADAPPYRSVAAACVRNSVAVDNG